MAEVYEIIAIVTFSISALCFILSIIMWFKFKISTIYKEVSGKNKEKVIAEYRKEKKKKEKKMIPSSNDIQLNVQEEQFEVTFEEIVTGTNETIT